MELKREAKSNAIQIVYDVLILKDESQAGPS